MPEKARYVRSIFVPLQYDRIKYRILYCPKRLFCPVICFNKLEDLFPWDIFDFQRRQLLPYCLFWKYANTSVFFILFLFLLLTAFYMSIRVFCVCLLYSKFQATMPSTNLRFFKIFSNERSDTLAVKNECYLRYQSSRPLKNAKYNDNHKYLFIGFLTHFASLLPLNEVNGNIGKKLIRMGHSTFGILKTVISVKFLNTIQK